MYCLDLGDRRLESTKTSTMSSASLSKASMGHRLGPFGPVDCSNKENMPMANLSFSQAMDVSQSKAYLMAMKTLQQKLEEKDLRIRQLEALLREHHQPGTSEPRLKERPTANFGHLERRGVDDEAGILRVNVHPLSLDQSVAKVTEEETSAACSGDLGFLRPGSRRKDFQSPEVDALQAKLEESLRDLDLTSKKLVNSKEQCTKLQESLDSANKQISMLEGGLMAKDKEINSLMAALKNMKELVDIISKNKKDGIVEAFDSIESLKSLKFEQNKNEFTLAKDRLEGPFSGQSRSCPLSKAINGKGEDKSFILKKETFEGIINDIITHVLLNPELSMDDIDLFECMRERLFEYEGQFKLIEDNYAYLKKTKNLLVQKSTVG
jgi:hypothetical protein